jgi:hypothetical protein
MKVAALVQTRPATSLSTLRCTNSAKEIRGDAAGRVCTGTREQEH